MACPSWSIRQNTARYRRLSRSMLKHCFAKVRADEASGHQLVVWQILAVYIICTGDYIVCGCCICAKVQPKFLLLAIVSIWYDSWGAERGRAFCATGCRLQQIRWMPTLHLGRDLWCFYCLNAGRLCAQLLIDNVARPCDILYLHEQSHSPRKCSYNTVQLALPNLLIL